MSRKKKVSKARRKVRALKHHDPTVSKSRGNLNGTGGGGLIAATNEEEWAQYEPEEYKKAPHSFVIHRGKVGRRVKELMKDVRHIMEPYTASKLKMTKGNVLKDYVSIASYFHVTHLCILSRTVMSPYLKICKIPRGPSLTFRILDYTLSRDVLASLKKQVTYDMQYSHHPLLIMNNFSGESKELEIMSSTFQNMFPPININKIQLRSIRRVLLLNYNSEDETVDLRHYTITYQPVGLSRGIKKLIAAKNTKIPNLGRCTDISEYLEKGGDLSESEGEDTTEPVGAPQKLSSRGTKGADEVGVKLVELGPRLKLQLIKVEEGLLDGEVLYHRNVEKTDEEKLAIRKQRMAKRSLKEKRKRVQNDNIERKVKAKEYNKKRSIQGMGPQEEIIEDDAEWYRKEVGEEPDEDTFSKTIASKSNGQKFDRKSRGLKRKAEDSGNRRDQNFKRPKVSKFAKVKEKAKIMKKEKLKHRIAKGTRVSAAGERERGRNAGQGYNSKSKPFKKVGSGVYTKPGRGKMSKKKP